jgi:hypothetical protein
VCRVLFSVARRPLNSFIFPSSRRHASTSVFVTHSIRLLHIIQLFSGHFRCFFRHFHLPIFLSVFISMKPWSQFSILHANRIESSLRFVFTFSSSNGGRTSTGLLWLFPLPQEYGCSCLREQRHEQPSLLRQLDEPRGGCMLLSASV